MQSNLYHNIPSDLPEEFFETLVSAAGVRIERIVSKGHRSDPSGWYDQEEAEWVALLKGEARLHFREGNRIVHLEPGDWINIVPHEQHRVEWTKEDEETVWLAVFYKA